jgi:hypothetical protein
MSPNTENTLNCVCPYGKNLPVDTEKCPKCGLNLSPLSRIYSISGKYNQLGDENKDKNRPGVALTFYNSAQQSAMNDDTYPLLQAIGIYIDEKNSKLASDLIVYAKELYPQKNLWEDVEKRLKLLNEEIAAKEKQQRLIKSGLYVTSVLSLILIISSVLFLPKVKSKEIAKTPLDSYASYYKNQFAISPDLTSIVVFSDSLMHFSGKLDIAAYQKFVNLLSSAELQLSKIDLKGVSVMETAEQPIFVYYKVRSGESLSKIAFSLYNDPAKWQIIYDSNKNIVANKNTLKAGILLKIPIEKTSKNE